jgi:glycerate-2-kinase
MILKALLKIPDDEVTIEDIDEIAKAILQVRKCVLTLDK